MKKNALLLFVVIILFQTLECYSQNIQDSTKIYRIETNDGNIFVGPIVSEDRDAIVLKTDLLGNITIPLKNVKSQTLIEDFKKVGNTIWLPNPQSTRHFWSPNGYGLDKGSAYYQNIWVFYNQVSVGLSDNFSIGAGMMPLFLFAGAPSPFWLVPKFSFPVIKDKINVGTGAFLGTVLGEETGIFGLLYGTSTFGSRDKNISLGVAYGFAQDDWLNVPIINVSGLIRVSPRGYLITENYIISGEDETVVIASLGGRNIIRNISLDYSLWIPVSEIMSDFVAVPFIGFSVPLGKKRAK